MLQRHLLLRLDLDSTIAGLLHDVVEDCGIEPTEIQDEFNPAVAQIVVGLTKFPKIKFKTKEESQAENFRKWSCYGQRYSSTR